MCESAREEINLSNDDICTFVQGNLTTAGLLFYASIYHITART